MDYHNTTDEHVLDYIRLMHGDLEAAVSKLPQSRVYLTGERRQMKADFGRIVECVFTRATAYAFRGLTLDMAGDYAMTESGAHTSELNSTDREHTKYVRWYGFDGRTWEVSTTVLYTQRAVSYHIYLTMDGEPVFGHMLLGARS